MKYTVGILFAALAVAGGLIGLGLYLGTKNNSPNNDPTKKEVIETKSTKEIALSDNDIKDTAYIILSGRPRTKSDMDAEALRSGWLEGYQQEVKIGNTTSEIYISKYPENKILSTWNSDYLINKVSKSLNESCLDYSIDPAEVTEKELDAEYKRGYILTCDYGSYDEEVLILVFTEKDVYVGIMVYGSPDWSEMIDMANVMLRKI